MILENFWSQKLVLENWRFSLMWWRSFLQHFWPAIYVNDFMWSCESSKWLYADVHILLSYFFSYSTSWPSWDDCFEQSSIWLLACESLWLGWACPHPERQGTRLLYRFDFKTFFEVMNYDTAFLGLKKKAIIAWVSQ